MQNDSRITTAEDLKPYHVFGMPLLKGLMALVILSAVLTVAYELLF